MGGFLLAPQVLDEILSYDTAKISIVVITRPLTFAVIAPLASLITIRLGERVMGVAGSVCVMGSMLAFTTVGPGTGMMLMLFALGLSGAGIGMSSPAMTSLVANAVDDRDLGVAGAMQQLMTQLGAVFGSVVMTSVQQSVGRGQPTAESFAAAFRVATGVALVAVLLSSRVTSTSRHQSITR
jgi:MFS family permease